jgi:hypothetical protein
MVHLDDASISFQDSFTEAVDVFDDLFVSGCDCDLASLLEHAQHERGIALEINFNGHGDVSEHCQDLRLHNARQCERVARREERQRAYRVNEGDWRSSKSARTTSSQTAETPRPNARQRSPTTPTAQVHT